MTDPVAALADQLIELQGAPQTEETARRIDGIRNALVRAMRRGGLLAHTRDSLKEIEQRVAYLRSRIKPGTPAKQRIRWQIEADELEAEQIAQRGKVSA